MMMGCLKLHSRSYLCHSEAFSQVQCSSSCQREAAQQIFTTTTTSIFRWKMLCSVPLNWCSSYTPHLFVQPAPDLEHAQSLKYYGNNIIMKEVFPDRHTDRKIQNWECQNITAFNLEAALLRRIRWGGGIPLITSYITTIKPVWICVFCVGTCQCAGSHLSNWTELCYCTAHKPQRGGTRQADQSQTAPVWPRQVLPIQSSPHFTGKYNDNSLF